MSSDPLPIPSSPVKPLPREPFPARSTSPPLPPRKNASGLPPTYLRHLKKLLHQWLEQQVHVVEDTSLTARRRNGFVEEERLWSDDRIQVLEQAIWEGAIIPPASTSGGKAKKGRALLELDWAEWIEGALKRKALWKEQQKQAQLYEALKADTRAEDAAKSHKSGKQSRKSSINESDPFGKGRLNIPGSPYPPTPLSLPSSSRTPSRPSSVASSSKSATMTPNPPAKSLPVKDRPEIDESGDEEEDRMREWCRIMTGLKGYQPFHLRKKDEWEILDDEIPKHQPIIRDVPGAFPQSSQYDYRASFEDPHLTALSSRTRFSDLGPPTPGSLPDTPKIDTELLKPVFCLHFPSYPTQLTTSSSTLRLKRNNSLGKKSISSIGSDADSKKWWGGSGGRWSELAIGPKTGIPPGEEVEVDFVEGQFALPVMSGKGGTLRQSVRKRSGQKRKSIVNAFQDSPQSSSLNALTGDDLSSTSDVEAEASAQEDDKAYSDSPVLTGSTFEVNAQSRGSLTLVITGDENDVPQPEVGEDEIGLVGGTIVINGVRYDEERQALLRILQLLLYTIRSMVLELELLDAFRIPREMDEPPLPPKPSPEAASIPLSPTKSRKSADLHRKGSLKDKGEKSKGFFHRLGKDTKHVWEGLLGKRRSSGPHDPFQDLPSPTMQSSDLPTSPLIGSIPAEEPAKPAKSLAVGLPETTSIPHPTERYLTVLSKLEQQLHSPTPAMRFPMPPLLLRVQEEDRIRREKAQQEIQDGSGQPVDGLPGDSPTLCSSPRFLNNLNKPPNPLHGRALNYRLGGDVRAGLGALSSGIDSFEGWIRLQRLDALYSVGLNMASDQGDTEVHICQAPVPNISVYWDDERDRSIQQVLDDINDELSEDNMVCPRPGCTATPAEHVRWWIHAGKKVGLKIESMEVQQVVGIGIDVWSKCTICGKAGQPREMGSNERSFSWGKVLEILIYTNILHSPNICSHTSNIIYYFRTPLLAVSLAVEDISILDTRLPKLQVGPNVTKRKGGKETLDAVMVNLLRKVSGEEKISGLTQEINAFFDDMEKKLDDVRDHQIQKVESASNGQDKEEDKTPSTGKKDKKVDDISDGKSYDWATRKSELEEIRVNLLAKVTSTPPSQINDVRQQFSRHIQDAIVILTDCQKIHTPQQPCVDEASLMVPKYSKGKDFFTPPGSSVLVKIDEPASIIAYTLSSLAYFSELTNTAKSTVTGNDDGLSTSTTVKSEFPSTFGKDTWQIDVKRRDTPRDVLGLRTITKKKSEVQISQPPRQLLGLSLAPNAPSLELSLEPVKGETQSSDRLDDLVKTINKATAQDPTLTLRSKSVTSSQAVAESDTDAMPRVRSSPRGMRRLMSDTDRPSPPSAFRPTATRSVSITSIAPSTPTSSRLEVTTSAQTPGSTNHKEGWGSVTSSFSNSFNQLLKLGSDVGESLGSIRVKGTDRSLSSLIGPLGMMSTIDNSLSSIDDRPHIQFTYTLGDRLKLDCTVYYATAFDSLRRRCAIDRSMIQSLSHTNAWDAQGGKSKAAFFMTTDKRYIVKELVSKWNVSDTHALLEISPAYFDYLAGTHNKATSLAKIVGFYTVRINDLQTGTKRQLDLLVMENLFYKQLISRTYDLKGIEGRKVKIKTEAEAKGEIKTEGTLFDGEWLEGMQKGLVLLQPHAKRILQEAISLDTRFLSSQSIMDYSLLIGVDEGKHELVVGLVDAIGSYNLFKTIESRGKLALNRGGEVTIIPPDQYRERFENALKHYFIACPDKWSKSSRRGVVRKSSGVPSGL